MAFDYNCFRCKLRWPSLPSQVDIAVGTEIVVEFMKPYITIALILFQMIAAYKQLCYIVIGIPFKILRSTFWHHLFSGVYLLLFSWVSLLWGLGIPNLAVVQALEDPWVASLYFKFVGFWMMDNANWRFRSIQMWAGILSVFICNLLWAVELCKCNANRLSQTGSDQGEL